MKAKLYIRSLKEPIDVSEEEGKAAERLKADRLAPNDTVLSIEGVWTGTKGDIRFVTFEKAEVKTEDATDTYDRDDKIARDKLLLKGPVERAGNLGKFKIDWFVRSEMKEKEPPEEVLNEARDLVIEYFRQNPSEPFYPSSVYEELLTKRWGRKELKNARN